MNTSNNIQNQEPKAVREAKTGRECYAFALYVKGEIKQFICAEWWMKHEDALRAAEGMAITARISHKTAGIGIYQLQDNGEYWLTDTRDLHADRTRFKFHKSRLQFPNFVAPTHEEEREAHRLDCWDFYNGADRLPLGWLQEAQQKEREALKKARKTYNERVITMTSKGEWDAQKLAALYSQEELTLHLLLDQELYYYWEEDRAARCLDCLKESYPEATAEQVRKVYYKFQNPVTAIWG